MKYIYILKKKSYRSLKQKRKKKKRGRALLCEAFLPNVMVSVPVRLDHFIKQEALRSPVQWQQEVSPCFSPLIHFDHTVDLIYKPEASKEANCT